MAEPLFYALSGSSPDVPSVPAYAGQPGPGPVPSPWRINGPTISYEEGGVTLPGAVPGGDKGKGTLNGRGLFVDGAAAGGGSGGGSLTSIFPGTGIVMTPNPITATGEVKFDTAMLLPYAPLASPALSGVPTAPTPAGAHGNDTTIANTAWVRSVLAGYAPLDSPAFTGSPTAPNLQAANWLLAPLLQAQGTISPRFALNATGNAADQKVWWITLPPTGEILFQSVNDALNTAFAQILFRRDGGITSKTQATNDNTVNVATTAFVQAAAKAFPAVTNAASLDVPMPVAGQRYTACSIGPLGNAGEKWRIDLGLVAADSAGIAWITGTVWDGSTSLGHGVVVTTPAAATSHCFIGDSFIVTLSGPTTFSLQASSGATTSSIANGSWITAQRVG